MKRIEVYEYGNERTYLCVNDADRALISHFTEGCPAFNHERLEVVQTIAAMHGYRIEVIYRPKK